jgi:CRISPR/Cas system-associated exonuclease Cas4 (RecB family)
MAKSYPDQLAEWVKRRESNTKRDKNLVAFLAVRGDIQLAIEAGYAVKTIWANMHEEKRVAFGYDTFLNYVNRHIRAKAAKAAKAANAADSVPAKTPSAQQQPTNKGGKTSAAPATSEPKVKAPDATPSFNFNSQPDVKELI